jgi:hypothetical protein
VTKQTVTASQHEKDKLTNLEIKTNVMSAQHKLALDTLSTHVHARHDRRAKVERLQTRLDSLKKINEQINTF